jgi:hypothetical protein
LFAPLFRKTIDERHRVVRVGPDDQPAQLVIVDQRQDIGKQFRRELFQRFIGAASRKKNIEKLPNLRRLKVLE